MRKVGLLVAFVLLAHVVRCQSIRLSDEAQISVITCGAWETELYSAFGHSAIRVYDPRNQLDDAFNYGVFDFNQPNFYLNFAKGFLYYKLGVYPYPLFRDHYISYNRFVHEQVLNLTIDQKQRIYDFLDWNAQPENQNYRYDYFYDNCATKIRDVFANVLKNEIAFDGSFITTNYTIRELTDLYLKQQPWGDLGIDICLGLPMDKVASPYEYMFLPDYIESSFDHATLKNDSATVPLVREKRLVYASVPTKSSFAVTHPWVIFTLVLVIVATLTYLDWRRGKTSKWLDVILFLGTGAVGLLLLLLWVATDHQAAARNLNLLWAVPLHLVAIPIYLRNSEKVKVYFKGIALLSVVLLLSWYWLPQQLHVFLIPIVMAMALRSAYIGWSSTKSN